MGLLGGVVNPEIRRQDSTPARTYVGITYFSFLPLGPVSGDAASAFLNAFPTSLYCLSLGLWGRDICIYQLIVACPSTPRLVSGFVKAECSSEGFAPSAPPPALGLPSEGGMGVESIGVRFNRGSPNCCILPSFTYCCGRLASQGCALSECRGTVNPRVRCPLPCFPLPSVCGEGLHRTRDTCSSASGSSGQPFGWPWWT